MGVEKQNYITFSETIKFSEILTLLPICSSGARPGPGDSRKPLQGEKPVCLGMQRRQKSPTPEKSQIQLQF